MQVSRALEVFDGNKSGQPEGSPFFAQGDKNATRNSSQITALNGYTTQEKSDKAVKKLIRINGEVQAMYLLFREHHLLPSAVMKLGYGEWQVLYAFIRYEMEERKKKKQTTK